MRFCPKCGKKGIKGDFCSECSEDELELSFKDIVMKKCIICDKFTVLYNWRQFKTIDEGIIAAALSKIKNPCRYPLKIRPIYKELKDKPGAKDDIELEVTVEGQEFLIPAQIDYTYCDHCGKIGNRYFEGELQVRDANKEVMDFVRKDIEDNKDKVHLVKETGEEYNADFQLTSAKYIRALGKKLVHKFNGELTETARLFTQDKNTSKQVHRINVLFRLHGFKVGDIVEYRGRKIKVKTLGKNVSGFDVETGKKAFFKYD